ncbi:MAG TPA: hypothetical protein VFV10_12880 [Gammaproteobacteria bacterium]|nr:hypothetical protein [Gammaproteobacteria bacterium]
MAAAGVPGAAHAQSIRAGEAADTNVCTSVEGADCVLEPGPDTPVPSEYEASYRVYLDIKKKAGGGTVYTRKDYAKMPDWSGVWTRAAGGLKFDPAQPGKLSDGRTTADLTPKFEAAYREKIRQVAIGNEWDQLSDCLPAGYPRWLTEPFLREMIVTPQETWWINEQQSEARRIYTDGRGHVPESEAKPLWDGDSIGFWDGDTLVVHTISVVHGQYQRQNPDYSQAASTIERIRMIDPNTIEDDVTVWDPKGLEKPWHVVDRYRRVTSAHARIDMWSCEANNNVIRTKEGSSQYVLPGETITTQRSYRDPSSFFLTDAQKKLFSDEIGAEDGGD